MSIEGKVALVTGASRGIGKAIAEALGKMGATVIGTATSESGAKAIDDRLKADGYKGGGVVLNVTDGASVEQAIKTINEQFGSIDILVNNAGITKDNILMRMKDEEWDDVIATNLTSVFRLSKACLRGMTKARWGRIINISSVVGGFARALAREIGSRNITVNTVAPGFIDTDMTHVLPEEQKQMLLGQIPLARLGKPEEIAAVVAFLASEPAAYITGETIHVNGGMYMS
jgi:3-oxoacyl-[acyl-carrier protein] reductase